jgi:periplasmic divalent cation tolerance protein
MESARIASRVLLENRAVACCNLLPGAESHSLWAGEYTVSQEVILIAKTTPENSQKARETLASIHPYACPAILYVEAQSNADFAAWAAQVTG